MEVQRLCDIIANPPPAPTFLIGNGLLIKQGKAVLYGTFKAGKSTLVQYIAMCVAGGYPLFGDAAFYTHRSKVYIVQLEVPYLAYAQRLTSSSLANMPHVADNIYTSTEFYLKLDTDKGIATLEEAVARIQPDLVVIDPLYKCISGSENEVQAMTKVGDNLDLLMEKYGFALLFTAQGRKSVVLPKGGVADLGDEEIRGSSAVPQWVDSILGIRRAQDTQRRISCTLRHGLKDSLAFTVDYDRKSHTYSMA